MGSHFQDEDVGRSLGEPLSTLVPKNQIVLLGRRQGQKRQTTYGRMVANEEQMTPKHEVFIMFHLFGRFTLPSPKLSKTAGSQIRVLFRGWCTFSWGGSDRGNDGIHSFRSSG